ncbi:hypothetical protein GF327_05480 [Candidatus Woesearchaeota archaeon]|nr:hypothetical protein [Candidatus Woesearchaeota archaeon]
MIDLKKIPKIIQKRIKTSSENLPKHIIISTENQDESQDPENKSDIYKKRLNNLYELIKTQVEINIPILTISLGKSENFIDQKMFYEFIDSLLMEFAVKNKVRVSFVGKWYSLKGMTVEGIKKIVNETCDFDKFFLNICINYDGQEEIADACRVIIRKVYDNRLKPDSINKEILKENLYSSYFIPADLIIEMSDRFTGTFLWDSEDSKIFFAIKKFENFSRGEFNKAIEYFRK